MISLKCPVGILRKTDLGYRCSVEKCPYGKLRYVADNELSPGEYMPICLTNGRVNLDKDLISIEIFAMQAPKLIPQ